MRERRQKLDSVRPKIVKVRPASSRQDSIINRQQNSLAAGGSSSGNSKIQQLRMEANVTSSRRNRPAKPMKPLGGSGSTVKPSGGGFGAAVAFAVGAKDSNTKRKAAATTTIQLAGNKRMKVPNSKKVGVNVRKRLGLLKRGGPTSRR
jgi:hypothetical protein